MIEHHAHPAPFAASASTAVAPPAPAGEALFQHWLSACAADPWAPLSLAAATPYRFIWGAWLKFLAAGTVPCPVAIQGATADTAAENDADMDTDGPHDAHGATGPDLQPWQNAEATQVLQFLNQSTRSQKQLDQPSDITRRRYWRVLERIYDHALLHGWVVRSPLDGIAAHERPPSEDPQGAILSPRMWRALLRQIPAATDLISARDRAVLLVLVHLGLSSEEVRGLVVDDLVWAPASTASDMPAAHEDSHAPSPETAPAPQSAQGRTPARIQAVRITGERAMQPRTLEAPPVLADALQTWLAYRAGYAAMQGQPALFCTRKAPALSTHTVLHLVSKTLQAASALHPQEQPPRMGPQVIRNTVIVHWLQSGMPETDVLQRAGLKTSHALGHLRPLVD